MSRLDSFLRRITAQRDCLNAAVELVRDVAGPVLELGLGNGRTFDHLRQQLPEREIFVFDRRVAAHPECVPDDDHMILGDFHDTLGTALERIGRPAALAHCDMGSGNSEADSRLARSVGSLLNPIMVAGGIVVSDQAMTVARWEALSLPPGTAPHRYHMWRVKD
ncbi:MAG: class I SAM-dependent methyltransferase [Rhodospirillales bacterium]|nr:class I SAM-dependent methyltransferase [Rhodospirillales bacterium]